MNIPSSIVHDSGFAPGDNAFVVDEDPAGAVAKPCLVLLKAKPENSLFEVEASPTMPAWHDAWEELGPESTEEERLAVYQAVRDSGFLPAVAGFYLVSWQIDAMTSEDAEVSLYHLDEQMKGIKEAHGLAVVGVPEW